MNLPNKLTILRILLIPLFLFFMLSPWTLGVEGDWLVRCIAALLFIVTAFTDFLDGHIARKYNLITDFGKFLDPLADKMMVLGAMLGLIFMSSGDASTEGRIYNMLTVIATFILLFRELSVTSLRLAASGSAGVVIAANIWGKMKTVMQIVFVSTALLEPVIFGTLLGSFAPFLFIAEHHVLSYITMALMTFMTILSGLTYFKAYFPLINSNK